MTDKPDQPRAFQNPDPKTLPPRKTGLKISNEKSILNEISKKPSKEEFEKKAAEVNQQLNSYSERAIDLAMQFKKALEDKTLPQNKTPFALDAERELLSKLTQLGQDMNNDEHEKEGQGSLGLVMLLFRTVLIQRDKINALEYGLNKLEQEVKRLSLPSIDTPK
jgi:hypothetical protein